MRPHSERKQRQAGDRVTQKDVARRAGVAVSSVSYVLNNGPRPVSEETRERVLEAIAELGYRPNEHAQRLMRQSWGAERSPRQFGIVIAGSRSLLARPYYSALIVGMLDEAARHNYTLRFIHLYDELQDPVRFNELIHRETVAGVVLMHVLTPLQRDRELLERVRERVGTVVCLDFNWPGLPSITFDKLAAGRLAVEHLIGLGHRRIAYLGDPDARFDGFLQGLRLHGIPFDNRFAPGGVGATQLGRALNTPEDGWRGLGELLDLPVRPTAVFAASDEVAIGALRAARERGVRVPEQLSIVGLDDIELASYVSPPLTTVRVPKAEMAALAVRTLVDYVEHPAEFGVTMALPSTLVARGSTGPAPVNKS